MRRLAARRIALPLAVGVGTALAWGGHAGIALGAGLAIGAWWWLRHRMSISDGADRRVEADLPYAVDLIAAVLRSGATPDTAAGDVGRAVGGAVGDRLELVARSLRLGAGAAEAWAYLGKSPAVARVIRAAVASERSGAALAGSLGRLADDLRANRRHAAEAAARRAGVLIVLPLGMCFLPAFVLAGVVPVVVAVLGDTLSQ